MSQHASQALPSWQNVHSLVVNRAFHVWPFMAGSKGADRAAVSASEAAAAAGPREAHPVGNTGITYSELANHV